MSEQPKPTNAQGFTAAEVHALHKRERELLAELNALPALDPMRDSLHELWLEASQARLRAEGKDQPTVFTVTPEEAEQLQAKRDAMHAERERQQADARWNALTPEEQARTPRPPQDPITTEAVLALREQQKYQSGSPDA